MDLDQKASELKSAKTPFCRATVVKSEGSSPRHIGARMIVTADASFGTIGGGTLEHRAIEDARGLLARRIPETRRYELGPQLGQCCGGAVEVFIDPVIPKDPVVVFGAGHIALSLCPMLANMDFEITLVDERPERMSLPAFDVVAKKLSELPTDIMNGIPFGDELFIIVITHQHKHDEEIVERCLDKPFRYLGMIGSAHKWETFRRRLLARGYTDEQLARVHTPIGLDIGAESPFEIAIAIAAELIQLRAKPEDFERGVGHFNK